MPIETHWANVNQSILIEKFNDVWTWKQVHETFQQAIYPQLCTVQHPVAIIQDMIGSHWTPTTTLLHDVQTMMEMPSPDNLVMLLLVSGNPAIDTLLISAYKRAGKDNCIFQACSTVNEALRVAGDYLNSNE